MSAVQKVVSDAIVEDIEGSLTELKLGYVMHICPDGSVKIATGAYADELLRTMGDGCCQSTLSGGACCQ